MRIVQRSATVAAALLILTGGVLPAFVPHALAVSFGLDKTVSGHQTSSTTSVSSPSFSTTQSNELLVAFIASDGPKPGTQTISAVTGGSLTWTMRKRINAQAGTAEIWTASAPNVLTNATVKATHSGSYTASITVAAFVGASTTLGAVGGGNAASGATTASITTTTAGSWVWGVGDDWDNATSRTVGSNQTKVDEFLSGSGDTFWTQRQTAVTPSAGTVVTLNDTAPTADRWNFAMIEILPAVVAPPDTTAPTAPTNLAATAPAATQVNLGWTAATDNVGVTGYKVLRDGTQISTSATTNYTDTTVSAGTTYNYTVRAYDAAGNTSVDSNVANVTTPVPVQDTTAPSVSLTTPADGSTLTGVANVSATATDNIGVTGVQFTLDGANLGAIVTTAPYNYSWNTATATNGTHTLSALAYDGAGNVGAATTVTVTVNNPVSVAPSIDPSTPAVVGVLNNVPTTTSPTFSPPAGTVLYAAFSMDSASYTGTTTTVASVSNSGTPLVWHLLGRDADHSTNAGGFVEVWWAYNPTAQSGITATATFTQPTKNVAPPVGLFQVLVMNNAAPDQSTAAWNVNNLLNSKDNAPFVNLTTTRANSQVFGIFDNWDNSQTPVPGANQSIQSIVLNQTDRDGYWLQKQNTATASAGTNVLMNATDPGIANEWHALAWEVLAN